MQAAALEEEIISAIFVLTVDVGAEPNFFFNGSRPLILVAFYPSRKEGSCDKGDRIPPSLLLERCGFGLDGWRVCVCCGVEVVRSGNVCLSSNIENETA